MKKVEKRDEEALSKIAKSLRIHYSLDTKLENDGENYFLCFLKDKEIICRYTIPFMQIKGLMDSYEAVDSDKVKRELESSFQDAVFERFKEKSRSSDHLDNAIMYGWFARDRKIENLEKNIKAYIQLVDWDAISLSEEIVLTILKYVPDQKIVVRNGDIYLLKNEEKLYDDELCHFGSEGKLENFEEFDKYYEDDDDDWLDRYQMWSIEEIIGYFKCKCLEGPEKLEFLKSLRSLRDRKREEKCEIKKRIEG